MPESRPRYEQLEHTADLALRIYGRTLRELFANAAYAMFSQLADLGPIAPMVQREVAVEGIDYESLLVNWLNELLYLQETRGEAYVTFEIDRLSRRHLQATVHGDRTENIHTLIKAATYHGLSINRTQGWYTSTVVFDV
jgi:SHS2 domain-containing protein